MILNLCKTVPPVELLASMKNLETEIKYKLTEMETKIKNVKSKKKNKVEKRHILERIEMLTDDEKRTVEKSLQFCDPRRYEGHS